MATKIDVKWHKDQIRQFKAEQGHYRTYAKTLK